MGSGKVVGANLKFYQGLRSAEGLAKYLGALKSGLAERNNRLTTVRVFPHLVALLSLGKPAIEEALKSFDVGAQDLHYTEDGSFTNAPISAQDLLKKGMRHVLLGHSETRVYAGITNDDVAKKLDAVLKADIFATVCLGQSPKDEADGKGKEVLVQQVKDGIIPALAKNDEYLIRTIWIESPPLDIAWEPLAAIKGFADLWKLPAKPPTDEEIIENHAVIRQALADNGYSGLADIIQISYGGSAKPENAGHLLALEGVDGLLVGTASWTAESMLALVAAAEQAAQGYQPA